jgi:hypothetical protein
VIAEKASGSAHRVTDEGAQKAICFGRQSLLATTEVQNLQAMHLANRYRLAPALALVVAELAFMSREAARG